MTTFKEMALSLYRYRHGMPPRDDAEVRRFEIFGHEGAGLVERMDLLAARQIDIAIPDTPEGLT